MASKKGRPDPGPNREGDPSVESGVTACVFCRVVSGDLAAHVVYEDALSMAFLDHRPLFPGHTLVIPRAHAPTLTDLPAESLAPFFSAVQVLAGAVERALGAQGSFVAVNNRISQSVPHLHVHVVPRRSKDGLKGFFWPRGRYRDEAEAVDVRERLRATIAELGRDRAPA